MISFIRSCENLGNKLLLKFDEQKTSIKCALIALALVAVVLAFIFAPPIHWGISALLINYAIRIPVITLGILTICKLIKRVLNHNKEQQDLYLPIDMTVLQDYRNDPLEDIFLPKNNTDTPTPSGIVWYSL